MDLIHVEPTKPRWAELADIHGIELCSIDLQGAVDWIASIEFFGEYEREMSNCPREAVVRLIHRLKLDGWQEVTV